MNISIGFDEGERAEVAQMYWAAFGQKLGRVMGPERRALGFIEDVLDPSHALVARDSMGTLLGVVGFKTVDGALVGGSAQEMRRHYGTVGMLWRSGLLALLEREVENTRFLMDGLFVAQEARGMGVGTALLDAISEEAHRRGYAELRLDVIDSNPRAKALYERQGFVAGGEQRLGWLRHVFGFAAATTMIRRVA